jgi:hypothetical protein
MIALQATRLLMSFDFPFMELMSSSRLFRIIARNDILATFSQSPKTNKFPSG